MQIYTEYCRQFTCSRRQETACKTRAGRTAGHAPARQETACKIRSGSHCTERPCTIGNSLQDTERLTLHETPLHDRERLAGHGAEQICSQLQCLIIKVDLLFYACCPTSWWQVKFWQVLCICMLIHRVLTQNYFGSQKSGTATLESFSQLCEKSRICKKIIVKMPIKKSSNCNKLRINIYKLKKLLTN